MMSLFTESIGTLTAVALSKTTKNYHISHPLIFTSKRPLEQQQCETQNGPNVDMEKKHNIILLMSNIKRKMERNSQWSGNKPKYIKQNQYNIQRASSPNTIVSHTALT
jgi:hypothetical protein